MLVIESCRLSSDARNAIQHNYFIYNFEIQNFVCLVSSHFMALKGIVFTYWTYALSNCFALV
jgi:hypothetical protein